MVKCLRYEVNCFEADYGAIAIGRLFFFANFKWLFTFQTKLLSKERVSFSLSSYLLINNGTDFFFLFQLKTISSPNMNRWYSWKAAIFARESMILLPERANILFTILMYDRIISTDIQ